MTREQIEALDALSRKAVTGDFRALNYDWPNRIHNAWPHIRNALLYGHGASARVAELVHTYSHDSNILFDAKVFEGILIAQRVVDPGVEKSRQLADSEKPEDT